MTRGQMRTLLRRQLQDVPEVQWPVDSELDALLNSAYTLVQKEIRKVSPTAHQFWDYINTVAGTSWYPLPQTFGIRRISLKQADGTYTKLTLKDYDTIKGLSGSETYYAKEGQWIGIFPAPTTMANGIELVHVPIMEMALDADVPRIKLPLHIGIVWWAKLLALGETADATSDTKSRLQELLGDIPVWYDVTSDGPEVLGVTI